MATSLHHSSYSSAYMLISDLIFWTNASYTNFYTESLGSLIPEASCCD